MNSRRGIHLLMADDDCDDCVLAKGAFKDAQIDGEMHFVGDGKELLEYLQHQEACTSGDDTLPDLILLDLNMPRKDGREALAEVKSDSRLKTIPVVILSTAKEEQDVEFCRKAGAVDFIEKPVMFEEWIEIFRLLIDRFVLNRNAG
ncbi:MAG: response regulator [Desulfobacteraceae bacterium]|nr:response regulator [Desulfobacteraceae bacterium]